MDRTPNRDAEPTRTVRKRIGFIGRGDIDTRETGLIWYIGRCFATLGKTVVLVPAKGAAAALKEGVEREGGRLEELTSGVIESADFTFIYPDQRLLSQLKRKYTDIEKRSDVLIIPQDHLDLWYTALQSVIGEKGLVAPE